MKSHLLPRAAVCTAGALLLGLSIGGAAAQTGDTGTLSPGGSAPRLELNAAQRGAIYEAVSKDKSKVAAGHFATSVGADVPPMIELYALPDDVLAANPTAKYYKYTMVQDQVVLVDPTRMRVIAVIGPRRME